MKTIAIGAQASAQDLMKAYAAALAEEIGWTAEDVSADVSRVKKEGINIFFEIAVTKSTYLYFKTANGYADISDDGFAHNSNKTYNLHVLKSADGTIAVGLSDTGTFRGLTHIIAQNTAGDYVGIVIRNTNVTSIRGVELSTKPVMTITPVSSTACTSIIKLPDIGGACMFKDLYAVVSCPFQSTNRAFYIDGKRYRTCNALDEGQSIAIPET